MKIYTTLGYIFIVKMFHQEASVETIKLKLVYSYSSLDICIEITLISLVGM